MLKKKTQNKKTEGWLSTALCCFSWWLFSDTVLSVIIWSSGHNWGEGSEESVKREGDIDMT